MDAKAKRELRQRREYAQGEPERNQRLGRKLRMVLSNIGIGVRAGKRSVSRARSRRRRGTKR